MTISKERFEQIALEVANDYGDIQEIGIVLHHAHALLKAVEQEAEVVGYTFLDSVELLNPNEVEWDTFKNQPEDYTKLIALPLVSEE